MRSLAYRLKLNNRALERGVCVYTYPGCTTSVSELSPSSDGAGGVLGWGGASRGEGAPMPLRLQCVCEFFAVSVWQGSQPSVWFLRTIAGCLSITAYTLVYLGNRTPWFFSSRTSARGFLIACCVSSIAARENPPLANLSIFKARRMSDCSSCTWPPWLAIVADMLKTYKKFVAASKVRFGYYLNYIWLRSLLKDV